MPSSDKHVYSVIDIGTNTCLLLIASLNKNKLTKLYEAQSIPRLGRDLYRTGKISEEAFDDALKIIGRYVSISKKYKSEKIIAFGTSALREAKNSDEFKKSVQNILHVPLKIISGKQEAKYSFEGATFDVSKKRECAVLDIGGGSTELSYFKENKFVNVSLKLGSVRIFEKFFNGNFSKENINNSKQFIEESLGRVNFHLEKKRLIGVAGTLTTLSAIKNGLKQFDEDIIHKDRLTFQDIENILEKLVSMDEEERLRTGDFMKGRSDIIICGVIILMQVMKRFHIRNIIVSTKGLRYGLLLNIHDFIVKNNAVKL